MIRKEEIEKASVDYQMSKHPMAIGGDAFADTIYKMNINPSFIVGAKWADQHPRKGLWDSEKVCKFLYEKIIDITYLNNDNTNEHYDKDEFIEDLRKVMEE